MAVDAVTGQCDLYQFESPPDDAGRDPFNRDDVLPVQMAMEPLRERVIDSVRRQVYQTGFFRLHDFQIEAECVGDELYIPYWVGFYRKGNRITIEVLDAVRNQLEGAKVRDTIQNWLRRDEVFQSAHRRGAENAEPE